MILNDDIDKKQLALSYLLNYFNAVIKITRFDKNGFVIDIKRILHEWSFHMKFQIYKTRLRRVSLMSYDMTTSVRFCLSIIWPSTMGFYRL